MKTLPRKSALLFGAMLAVCAFAVPSMASAASWSPVGTTHRLFMSDLVFKTFQGPPDITIALSCTATEFDADVVSASTIEITNGSFQNCRGLPGGVTENCTVTVTGTRFPWTMTAPTTTNIQIHGIDADLTFEHPPGANSCNTGGLRTTWTGTLTGGSWDPSAVGADRRITFATNTGTAFDNSGLFGPLTVSGSLRDTTGTLNLLD